MTQQRPNETDEEYEKRKRRVKLTMMGGLANGGGSIIAAAAIYYQDNGGNFLYIPDGSGNLVLDNKGSLGPTYDGLLYSGRGIELGATNDTIVGDAAKWTTWFDFADATHKTVFGVKTFNSITTNSILVSASEPSALTLAKFNNNPNLVGKLALSGTGTISEVDLTLVSGDEYYMCSEKSGAYLVDARAGYGADTLNAVAPLLDNSVGGATVTFTSDTSNNFNLAVTVVGTSNTNPSVYTNTTSPTAGHVIVSFDVVVNSGTPVLTSLYAEGGNIVLNETLTTGTHSYILASGANTLIQPRFDGTNLFDISVTGWTVREATATEIANYASTVRTNADLQQKGIQTTAFVTDGAGVPTAYSSNLLQFTGDGRYVDAGFIFNLSNDTTFEFVYNHVANATYKRNGTGNTYFGGDITNKISFVVGGVAIVSTNVLASGIYHLLATFNSSTNQFTFYLNGVSQGNAISTTNDTNTFYIGDRNGGTKFYEYSPIGLPKISYKYMTPTEVATAYAKAKTIYPTLP